MVGSALVRRLKAGGFTNLLEPDRADLNLLSEAAVFDILGKEKPDVVILAAARVGGIKANNDHPVGFLLDNLLIQNNVIRFADQFGVRKLLFLGSRSEEHTSELQSHVNLVCRLLLEKKKNTM